MFKRAYNKENKFPHNQMNKRRKLEDGMFIHNRSILIISWFNNLEEEDDVYNDDGKNIANEEYLNQLIIFQSLIKNAKSRGENSISGEGE